MNTEEVKSILSSIQSNDRNRDHYEKLYKSSEIKSQSESNTEKYLTLYTTGELKDHVIKSIIEFYNKRNKVLLNELRDIINSNLDA